MSASFRLEIHLLHLHGVHSRQPADPGLIEFNNGLLLRSFHSVSGQHPDFFIDQVRKIFQISQRVSVKLHFAQKTPAVLDMGVCGIYTEVIKHPVLSK